MKPINDRILWDIIDGLRDELNIANDGINDLNDVVKDLQAEAIEQIKDNKRLNDKDGLYDEVKELQAELDKAEKGRQVMYNEMDAEVRELQAEIDNLKGENIDLINHADFIEQGKIKKVIDGFKAEIKRLKAEIKSYINAREGRINTINDLNKINDRLISQVNSNRGNSSSTHTHTISKEIAEYMNHHPEHKEVRLFILPIEEFDEDECCHKWLTWDEGVEV